MPFATTLEKESDGYQLFSVAIDDVDREQDRLVVRFEFGDETEELVFALVDDEHGSNLLRLDADNSDCEAVESIRDSMREELKLENPEQEAVYMLADIVTDSSNLMLTLPPTIQVIIDNFGFSQDLELEDGETVTVEPRTLV